MNKEQLYFRTMKKLIINRNEMIAGPSPTCIRTIKNFAKEHIFRYLDGYYQSPLINKLAKVFRLSEQQIIFGYGSELLLAQIFNSAVGGSILTHEHYYSFYDKYLPDHNIPCHIFKNQEIGHEFIFDIEDCLRQYKKLKPKVLIITSPNNPTGNTISFKNLEKIMAKVSEGCLVVIDQAYWGVDEEYNDEQFLSLLTKNHNLLLLRSFSKLYALAGLRIAFGLCGKNVKKMINYNEPYLGFNRILEEVGVAALESKAYYAKIVKKIIADRKYFIQQVNKLRNFKAYSSKATFVLVKIDDCVRHILDETLSKAKFSNSKFVTSNLMRVSLDPQRYTKEFLKIIIKVDAKNKH